MRNGGVYPRNVLRPLLEDLATILRAEVGLTVATVDVPRFDTHVTGRRTSTCWSPRSPARSRRS